MEVLSFLDRVLQRLPATPPTQFQFFHWNYANRPTDEGFGIIPIAGVDPAKVMAAVMDLDHYVGNVEHVAISRSIADPRFVLPEKVHFYQKVEIPLLGPVQLEAALYRLGEKRGYQVAAWELLKPETDALSPKVAARSDYNLGAWFAAPGVIGYALSSAPKREDVGMIKWKILTAGADVAAAKVLQANLEGMARWAARHSG